jgi:hypothetical protein
MKTICVACACEIESPLYTYGDLDAPMCQSCHLGLLSDDYQPLYSYDDLGDGWLLKRLTEAGAVVLGGVPGQALMRVNRALGIMEFII